MAYVKTTWSDGQAPALSAANLNKIEQGIFDASATADTAKSVTDSTTDFVVDEGTDGDWTYRKWNSGIAECWGQHTQTITGTAGWGSIYYTTPTAQIDYPTSLFIIPPTLSASNVSTVAQGSVAVSGNNATRCALYVVRGASAGSSSVIFSVYAVGKWR